jgi:uncharacterized cupin superfamily protein
MEGKAMSYQVAEASEIEPLHGVLRRVRRQLGLRSFGLNQADMPPNFEHYPEHDELETGQEEVFVCVTGSGTLSVDGDPVDLQPGRYVLVSPESKRKIMSGPNGLSVIAIGSHPERGYQPHGDL